MRRVRGVTAAAMLLIALRAPGAEPLVLDRTHSSAVMRETRNYRLFLPPDYGSSTGRYPVIYWFHGWSERHNKPVAGRNDRNYDRGNDYGGDTIAAFVAKHPVIVVKWDGYNPRTPDEAYPRPYNISPVETSRQFPLYFPELVAYIDANYRTIADREHRATAGLSMGGFMSFWVAGKYPHLVSSASNFMGSSEFYVGPRGFDVEYRHEEMRLNYNGVRTRLVTGSRDFIRFYHQRMNAIWQYTRDRHETEEFDFDHGTPGMAKTLDFHMRAFADPLPRPAEWSHADVYPAFDVWGWEVVSDRRQPGFTVLENVSSTGLRSSVREWLPGGRLLSNIKVSIITAKLYPPMSEQVVTMVRLRDGRVTRSTRKADKDGRLTLELDGDEYEIGIGRSSVLTIAGLTTEEPWATAKRAVRARVRFLNKGAAALAPVVLRWQSPNPGLSIPIPAVTVPALAPGAATELPLIFTVSDETREIVKLFAAGGKSNLTVEVPLFPAAEPAKSFQVADGRKFQAFEHAVEKKSLAFGEGNADGKAARGETLAILIPDGDAWRAAELFTNDRCIDLAMRVSDVWSSYDHVGASSKYSLPVVRKDCPPGHVVRLMTRVQLPDKPNHKVEYGVVEVKVE